MDFLPITIRTKNKKVLIVGGGKVATHKAQILSRFIDSLTIIAPEVTTELTTLPFTIKQKEFEENDLEGIDILFICTGNHLLNKEIKQLAEKRKILTSVCDNPAECDFISPAIAKHEHITIAVGSDSQNVKQSIRIRNRINELIENGILRID